MLLIVSLVVRLCSKEAATYDTRHEKAISEIIEKVRDRLDFIGVAWADDEGDDEDGNEGVKAKRPVRLLDYASGPGTISRVRKQPYLVVGIVDGDTPLPCVLKAI